MLEMDFSELSKVSNHQAKFSPNGEFLARSSGTKVYVQEAESLRLVRVFNCAENAQVLEWSPDSTLITASNFPKGIVQIWSLEQAEWSCTVSEGSLGLTSLRWAPDSRHVITTAIFHLRITIWSLTSRTVRYLENALKAQPGLDFTHDGRYMAVAERRKGKDYVAIFVCSSWQLVKRFESVTNNMSGLRWSPDDSTLCVWDSSLNYKVALYSPNGFLISTFTPQEWLLGVRSMAWAPSGKFVALGSFDEKVRVLNHLTWMPVTIWDHPGSVTSDDDNVNDTIVYLEKPVPSCFDDTAFEIADKFPVVLSGPSGTESDSEALSPGGPSKTGISRTSFSPDNRFVASMNDRHPTGLWIWSMESLQLHSLLVFQRAIKDFAWSPTEPTLAACTETNKVFFWSLEGTVSVRLPQTSYMEVSHLGWHPQGGFIALTGREYMCICHVKTKGFGDE